jgi:hypothetical protein
MEIEDDPIVQEAEVEEANVVQLEMTGQVATRKLGVKSKSHSDI